MPPALDDDLPRRAAAGERSAQDALLTRWSPVVMALAYRLTGDRAEADEIHQAALVKVFRGLASFDGRAAFSTWLYRITVNLCRDRLRARVAAAHREHYAAVERNGHTPRTPADEAERGETAAHVARAVAALDPGEREVVVLRHYHGLTLARIGAVLDLPPTTVQTRLARGLARLRVRLADLQPS